MGVRTRGLDIKAGTAKLKADKAARLEAEFVIDRWNRRLATALGALARHRLPKAAGAVRTSAGQAPRRGPMMLTERVLE